MCLQEWRPRRDRQNLEAGGGGPPAWRESVLRSPLVCEKTPKTPVYCPALSCSNWVCRGTESGVRVQTQGLRNTILTAMVSVVVPWVWLPLAGAKGSGPITFKIQGKVLPSLHVCSFFPPRVYINRDKFHTVTRMFLSQSAGSQCAPNVAHTGLWEVDRLSPSMSLYLIGHGGRKISKLSLCWAKLFSPGLHGSQNPDRVWHRGLLPFPVSPLSSFVPEQQAD